MSVLVMHIFNLWNGFLSWWGKCILHILCIIMFACTTVKMFYKIIEKVVFLFEKILMFSLLLSDLRICEWESEYNQQEWCCLWVSEVKFFLCILIENHLQSLQFVIKVYHSNKMPRMFDVAPHYLEIPATGKNCCVLKCQIFPEENCHCNIIIVYINQDLC